MAADTPTKRLSAMGLGDFFGAALPVPDGTVDAGDRAMLLDLYALAGGTVTIPDVPVIPGTQPSTTPSSSGGMGTGGVLIAIPPNMLKDRFDLSERMQGVANQGVFGGDEIVLARDVPCLVSFKGASRFLTKLGIQTPERYQLWLGREPELFTGFVVTVTTGSLKRRYSVLNVRKEPNPHSFQFQVAELAPDEVTP